jgi:hypothetical protein
MRSFDDGIGEARADDIESDFIGPALSRDPREYDRFRELLIVANRCLDLVNRIMDEYGEKRCQ